MSEASYQYTNQNEKDKLMRFITGRYNIYITKNIGGKIRIPIFGKKTTPFSSDSTYNLLVQTKKGMIRLNEKELKLEELLENLKKIMSKKDLCEIEKKISENFPKNDQPHHYSSFKKKVKDTCSTNNWENENTKKERELESKLNLSITAELGRNRERGVNQIYNILNKPGHMSEEQIKKKIANIIEKNFKKVQEIVNPQIEKNEYNRKVRNLIKTGDSINKNSLYVAITKPNSLSEENAKKIISKAVENKKTQNKLKVLMEKASASQTMVRLKPQIGLSYEDEIIIRDSIREIIDKQEDKLKGSRTKNLFNKHKQEFMVDLTRKLGNKYMQTDDAKTKFISYLENALYKYYLERKNMI